MTPSVVDTSFVVALGNHADKFHKVCSEAYRQQEIIYLPQSVLAEVGYMLNRELGNRAVASFLRKLPDTKYRPLALDAIDFLRTAELLERYADSRVDFVDATIAVVAERLGITRILTLDQRDFRLIRPNHAAHFEILPTP